MLVEKERSLSPSFLSKFGKNNEGGLLPEFEKNDAGGGDGDNRERGGAGGSKLLFLSLLLILLNFCNLFNLSFNLVSFVDRAFSKHFFIFLSINLLASILHSKLIGASDFLNIFKDNL